MSKVLIEFTKDFAIKKKGDVQQVDSLLARTLIDKKVAKKRERKPAKKEE